MARAKAVTASVRRYPPPPSPCANSPQSPKPHPVGQQCPKSPPPPPDPMCQQCPPPPLSWLPVPNYTPQQPLRGKERGGKPESGRALMLAATEPQVIQQRRERVTNGGRSPIRTRRLRLIWLPVPQETTSPAATLTPLSMDPPSPAPRPSDYPCSSANAAPTPTPTMAERAHPCNNNRGQPRTVKDSPEKTPGAPQTHFTGLGGGRLRTPPSPQVRGCARRGTSPGPQPLD